MGQTAHRNFPYPDATAVNKPRLDITALANDLDTKLYRITYGTGPAPSSGMRAGDIHLQYSATALAFDENVALPDEE